MDKCTLAALETTLRLYQTEPDLSSKLPILWLLTRPIEEMEQSTSKIVKTVSEELKSKVEISVKDGHSRVGGGSLPVESLPTKLIALKPLHISPDELAARLRRRPVPVIARIHQDTVLLDVRTIRKNEEVELVETLQSLSYE